MNDSKIIKDGEINLLFLYRKYLERIFLFFVITIIVLSLSNFYIYQYNANAPKEGKIDVHLSSNSIDSISNTLLMINNLTFNQNSSNLLQNFNSTKIYNSLFNDINLLSQQKKIIIESSEKFDKPFTKSKYKINVEKFNSLNDVNSKIVIAFTDRNEDFIKFLLNRLIENSSKRVNDVLKNDIERYLSSIKTDSPFLQVGGVLYFNNYL